MDNGDQSSTLFFMAKNYKMAKLPQNFWREFPLFFFSKRILQTPPYFGGVCRHQSVCLSVSLSTGHNFNDPVQKVSPVKAKSVWICLGILASVATVQKGKPKDCWRASLGRLSQISPGWRHYFKELLKLKPVHINVATASLPPSLPLSPQKTNLQSLLRNFKWKISFCFFPFVAYW